MKEIILAKCGEIVLKGLNRRHFESMLLRQVRGAVKPFGQFTVDLRQSTVYVEPETEETTEEVTEETTEETTESTTESTEATEETTEQTDSAEEETQETEQRKTLPTMAKEEKETVKPDKNDLTYGYVSWTCVVAGVLVLAIVLISTKRK